MRNRFSTLATGILLVLATLIQGNLLAQCNLTIKAPLDNVTINLTGSTVVLDGSALGPYLEAADGSCTGCALEIEDPLAPGTWVSSLTLSCDASTSYSSGAYRVRSNTVPPVLGCESTPVDITVLLIDDADPMIDDASLLTPNCGGSYSLNTSNNYTFSGDAVFPSTPSTGNCASTFRWTHPDFTDNCSWGPNSSLEITFSAGVPAPSALPAPFVTVIGGGIPTAASTLINRDFYSGAAGCTGVTIVTYTLTDESGRQETCSFSVTVTDNEFPTWDDPTGAPFWPSYSAITSATWNISPVNRLTITLDCNAADYTDALGYFSGSASPMPVFTPVPTDNCSVSTASFYNSSSQPTNCTVISYERYRWTATDDCGNLTPDVPTYPNLFKLDLIVEDNYSPSFDPADGAIVPVIPVVPSGPDDAKTYTAGTLSLNVSDYDPGLCSIDLIGSTLLEVTATDCQGLNYAWEILTSLDGTGFPTGLAGTTGSDNNADLVYPVGTHVIAYSATESCAPGSPKTGNYIFTLEIVDDVAPTLTDCPVDVTLSNVLDNCFQNTIWNEANVSDNCPGTVNLMVSGQDPEGNALNILTFQGTGCTDQIGFDGDFIPANWTIVGAGVDFTGAPGLLEMNASTADVTIPSPKNGIYSFSWAYTPVGFASSDDFGYTINGTFYPLIIGAIGAFGVQTGFAIFSANAGDVIGFRLLEDGPAPNDPSVDITNFNFDCGSSNNVSFASFPVGVSTVTYKATDLAGNMSTCSFNVTVNDTQDPEITCGGDLFLPTICVDAMIPDYTGNIAVINENCPDYTVTQLPLAGTTIGTILAPMMPVDGSTFDVTLEITDKGGNKDQCVFTVTLQDNGAPVPDVMPLPAINTTTTLFTDCSSFMLCAPTATDCNGNVIYGTASIAGATLEPNGCGVGMPGYLINAAGNYAVNWIYDDGNGNFAQQSQQVDLLDDTTQPTLNCPPDITVDTDPGVCTTTGILGLQMTPIIPTVAPYLAVVDQPADGEMIDNCGITQIGWSADTGAAANTDNAGAGPYQKGLNIVTYTASDAAGNIGTCSFNIAVEDHEDPSFTCVGNTSLVTGSSGDDVANDCAYTLGGTDTSLDPTMVTDNCPGPYTISRQVASLTLGASFSAGADPASLKGSTFNLPPTGPSANFLIIWTVTDASLNSTTCSYQINVSDGEKPTITCALSPIIKTTSQDGLGNYDCAYTVAGSEFDPTAYSDNCFASPPVNDYNSLSTLDAEDFPKGTTIVEWTVTDAAMNSATCVISITVNDDEAPIYSYCPTSVVLPNIAGDCNNDVAWQRPNENDWDDNCDPSNLLTITESISDPGVQASINNNYLYDQTVSSNPQTSFPVGTTTIVYTATDQANNSATCSFTVTIQDIEAPSVICPADQILGITCGQGTVQNYIPSVTLVSDNCSDYTITQNPVAGTALSAIPGLTPADGEVFDVTITVTDNKPLGLSTSCTFTVTLDEVSVPVPTINGPNLAAAFSECNDITIAAPTAMECGSTIYGIPSQGTLVNVFPPVYQFGIGNYFITWTYVGANGSVQQSQQITVLEDLMPPNAQCKPVNVNLSSMNPGSVTVNATAFNNGSTDNCTIVGYSYSVNGDPYSASKMFGCANEGSNNITLEVLDFNGNKGYCNTTLTINDITPPTIIGGCPSNLSFNTSNNGGYDCEGLATIPVPNVTDNCAIQTYVLNLNGPSGSTSLNALNNPTLIINLLKGLTTATYAVTDEHGLQSTCVFNITVVDDEFPVITCAASGSRNTSADGTGDCEYTINGAEFDPISFNDNCPGATVSNSMNGGASLTGEVLTTGVYPVTWTVTDAVGHKTTCTIEITIVDDEAPIINQCQSDKMQNVTAGTCNALVTWAPTYGVGTGHVMDNCEINTITQSISDPNVIPVYPYNQNGPYAPFQINQALFPIGITTISYTVTDINGNSSVCSFEIEVIDNIAPTVTCPPNQIMNTICADGTVQDYLGLIQNVSDNCSGNLIYTQSPAEGTPLSSVPGLTPADGESFTVTITVQDPKPLGLSGNCTFSVTLDDVNLPVPDEAQLLKDSTDCNVLVLSPPTANDCGTVLNGIPDKGNQISFNPPLYEFTKGLYTVIWTYVGTNGSVQQTQQIIVENDLVPPVMDCDDLTINLDASGNASITPAQIDGGTKDNCGIANLALSKSTFTCSDVGPNTVILTATDIHGNSNTCSAIVTVKDVTIPTFNISNSTVTVNCQSVPGVGNVLASDACGILSNILTETTSKGLNANNCNYYTYTITRRWTATDVNNNVATVQQVINVVDNNAPAWTTAMPDTIYGVTNQFDCKGQIFLIVDAFKVTDNCAAFSNLTISYTGTNGFSGSTNASGQYPIGKTTLTFTATDPCGNHAFKDVVIIIEDKTPPTAVCVNSITLPLNPQGNLIIPPFIVDNGSYDNCLTPFSTNEVSLAVMPDTFNCDDAGKTFTITLTVTDLAGNTASCPATLTVIDNTIPTLISCAPDVTVDCQDAIDPLVLGFPMVSDACGTSFDFTDTKVSVGGAICYNIIRNWSIVDGSGNNLNCTQTISVTDNQAPIFTSVFPADITIACGLTIPTPPIVAASDNCGTPVSVAITENSTQTNNNTCTDYAYIVTRTWTATDACGNATFHTQTITVVDIQAPVIFGLPDSLTLFTNDFNADSCTVPVTLQAQFIDCQDPGDITIVNNSPVGSGGISASGKYSADQLYTITFTATDLCGNSSQKVVKVRVIDNSIPNAYCIAQVNVTLNSDGLAVITPVQIDDQSKDNCTAYPNLDFELSKDSFDCKNLGANIVEMTVTDEQGNSNTCSASINVSADPALTINTTVTVTPETFMNANDGAINVAVSGGSGSFTYLWTPGNANTPSISNLASGTYTLMITDNNTGCMKTLNVFVQIAGVPFDTISGRIITPGPLHKPVARVYVNMTGSQSGTYYTGLDGYYEFIVPSGSTVTIRPYKDTLPANGVTALDFSIIQQHILAPPNLKPLTTPYRIIAADENGNNQINGIDIAQFNFTILNNKDTFPNVNSWVFVDSTFIFPMPTEPWATGWDDEITYPVISGNKPNTTFIAVKMGDVNGDVDVTKLTDPNSGETRGSDDLILTIQDQDLTAGAQIAVPVSSENFRQILAYQFAWGFDPTVLEFTGATGQALSGLSGGNFGTQGLKSGLLTHLWASNTALDVTSETPLFTMYFNVLKDGFQLEDVLNLTNSYMGEIAYTSPNVPNGIALQVKPITDTPVTGFALLGNRPNPFSDQTLITFTLPENAEVKLTVLDITGKPVVVRKTEGVAGMNAIPVHQSDIAAPGLYHYILESNGSRVLGKMIHQD